MVSALACVRGQPTRARSRHFHRAGIGKYAACTVVGAMAAVPTWPLAWPLGGVCFVLAFYALEARLVFVFPAMIDYGSRASRGAGALVRRAGGVPEVMSVVMPLAAVMLCGGFAGRGFVRSWLLGCAAVVLWYERLRTQRGACVPRLELGRRAPLHVRRELVCRASAACEDSVVLYASDLHFGVRGSSALAHEVSRIAAAERPDLILLGGDLVDGRRGLPELERAILLWSAHAPVLAICGNHDRFAGSDRVRTVVEAAGGQWLEDEPFERAGLVVDANPRIASRGSVFRLLCAHDPKIFPSAATHGYDLVLAGHLHGGQVAAFELHGRSFPGAFFYRWNGAEFRRGASRMFVCRGAADTLPLRWRCPREVIVCRVGASENRSVPSAKRVVFRES